ncbi:hypothetical protein VU04_06980 [Desulfobulbus sp. TB]|nr:hypothetical protein [Desulfobulbus sp. TB]
MKTTSQKIRTSFISAAAILFAAPLAAQAALTQVSPDEAVWKVKDSACVIDGNAVSCSYTIEVTDDPDLSHMDIEILDGVDAVAPGTSTGQDGSLKDTPYEDGNYVKWDDGQSAGTEQVYTVDFQKNPTSENDWTPFVGTCSMILKGARLYTVVDVPGPCLPSDGAVLPPELYSISGNVIMDADLNGPDEGEMGISNVTVELRDEEENVVASMPTSESGGYEFTDLPIGEYTVVILPENDILDDFNEILADYFFATTETEVSLTLTEDVVEDFGFAPDVDKVISDIDGVTLKGDGLTIGFWKHQNAVADKGKGRAQVDAETLQGYIDAIEELLLEEPFQFDDANEFRAAHEVMAMRTSDAAELLRKQLLGTEFNDVAGRGLEAPFDELQDKLIAWGEYLAANSELFTRDELIKAKDIFDLTNNTSHM